MCSVADDRLMCRCLTELRAAIEWSEGLLSYVDAHKLADSGEICEGCRGLFEVRGNAAGNGRGVVKGRVYQGR